MSDEAIVEIRRVIEVVTDGIQGPQGQSAGLGYLHSQASAATEWVVAHNLGVKPNYSIYDAGGNVVDAQVLHISANELRVYFSSARAGFVRCN